MGTLFIVATPIGNLKDISERAEETLKNADCIFAEDTRVARKLLNVLGIRGKCVERLDEHVESEKISFVKKLLKEGKNCAFISDAGTPGICDPGYRLVHALRTGGVRIVPIPGPSAITSALSIAGVSANHFLFLGYPPHKKGRKTFFEKIGNVETWPIVLFESPHRIIKTLQDIQSALGQEQPVIVVRELTKIHEEVLAGSVSEILQKIKEGRDRGEFVVIVPEKEKRSSHER